jgi:hypothetical protein
MSFWRRNQIEFIADIIVYLNVSVYGDDYCGWFNWHLGDWKYVILDDDDDMGVTLI